MKITIELLKRLTKRELIDLRTNYNSVEHEFIIFCIDYFINKK